MGTESGGSENRATRSAGGNEPGSAVGRVVAVEVGRPALPPTVRWFRIEIPPPPPPTQHLVELAWTERPFVPADPVLGRPAFPERSVLDGRCRSCSSSGALAVDPMWASDPVARDAVERRFAEALHGGAR